MGTVLVVAISLVLGQVCEALATPDPELFAQYLHESVFSAMMQAFVFGVGFGLLVKMINRS